MSRSDARPPAGPPDEDGPESPDRSRKRSVFGRAGAALVGFLLSNFRLRSDARREGQDAFSASPFSRLALTQMLSLGGDALVTVALAGSLFFNISVTAARGRVALSLVLTIAPFAIVAPFLGPIIDRLKGGRRAMIVASAIGRIVACLFMARYIHGLLLFPAAFLSLVSSKAYTVAKAAIVPAVVEHNDDLVEANSKLAVGGAIAGFLAFVPGVPILKLFGAAALLRVDSVVYLALRHQRPAPDPDADDPDRPPGPGARHHRDVPVQGPHRPAAGSAHRRHRRHGHPALHGRLPGLSGRLRLPADPRAGVVVRGHPGCQRRRQPDRGDDRAPSAGPGARGVHRGRLAHRGRGGRCAAGTRRRLPATPGGLPPGRRDRHRRRRRKAGLRFARTAGGAGGRSGQGVRAAGGHVPARLGARSPGPGPGRSVPRRGQPGRGGGDARPPWSSSSPGSGWPGTTISPLGGRGSVTRPVATTPAIGGAVGAPVADAVPPGPPPVPYWPEPAAPMVSGGGVLGGPVVGSEDSTGHAVGSAGPVFPAPPDSEWQRPPDGSGQPTIANGPATNPNLARPPRLRPPPLSGPAVPFDAGALPDPPE